MSGEANAWLGRLARGLAHTVVRFYYPRIEVSGGEDMPATGPVLLVANHPNSLLDPVLLGLAAGRPVRLLAKAPLFEVRGFGRLLRELGMIPAYRGSDQASAREVARNLESLGRAAQALGEDGGSVIGIFPEGRSHDDPQVVLVRSGAARMAMAAVAGGVRGLRIVPVGLNYESKARFRSAVWVQVGEPIDADEWWARHGGEERAAMRALTPEIDRRLKRVVVHLEEASWAPLLEEVEGLLPAARGLRAAGLLRLRKRVAEAINHFHAVDRTRAEELAGRLRAWRARRQAAGLPADARFFRQPLAWRLVALTSDAVRLPVALVVGGAGLVHHLVPHAVTRWWAARLDQPGQMTVALNRLLVGLPVHSLWYAVVGFGLGRLFQPWVVAVWLAAMPLAGLTALWLVRRLRLVLPVWWAEVKLMPQRETVAALRRERAERVEELVRLAAEVPAEVYADRGVAESKAARSRLVRPPRWLLGLLALGAAAIAAALAGWLMRDRPLEWRRTVAPALHRITDADLRAQVSADERGLDGVIEALRVLEERFNDLEQQLNRGDRSFYRPEDDDEIRRLLVSYLSLRAALLRTVWYYQRWDQVADETLRLRCLLTHYAAAAVLYECSARFVLAFEGADQAVRKLNEAEPRWDLPAGTYDEIRANLANVAHRRWLEDGWRHYHATLPAWRAAGYGPDGDPTAARLHAAILRAGERTAALSERLLPFKVATAVAAVRDVAGGGYYRASAAISTLIGDAKLRTPRGGRPLVTPELLERLRPLLQPGDILIERRNWYLSNAFLPGYWPHAALYVGTAGDLQAMGLADDPAVAAKWAEFTGADARGHSFAVIEAVSEGVVFTSLAHSVGEADAVAVLRPRLTPEQKREAIARAFSHAGKPYDFDFDFFSSDKLVCTELVYRAYGDALRLPLVEILGRRTLPALDIVRAWAEPAGEAQFDFVALLDGDERTGECTWADAETLRESITRPPLTWLN